MASKNFDQMVANIVSIGYETSGDLDEAVRIYSERHNVTVTPAEIEKIKSIFEAEFHYEYDTESAAAQA